MGYMRVNHAWLICVCVVLLFPLMYPGSAIKTINGVALMSYLALQSAV